MRPRPHRTVALRLGVSDVGLAKACRASAPAGLVGRGPCGEQVVIAPTKKHAAISSTGAAAAADAEAVPVPEDQRWAHPIVRGWIAEDAATRRGYRREGWSVAVLADLTTPPINAARSSRGHSPADTPTQPLWISARADNRVTSRPTLR